MVWTAGLWVYLQTPSPSWRYFVASALCFSHLPAWTVLMIPCSYVCMIRFFYCYGRALSLKFSLAGDVLDCNFNSLTPILFFPCWVNIVTNLLEFNIQLLTSVTDCTYYITPISKCPVPDHHPTSNYFINKDVFWGKILSSGQTAFVMNLFPHF